MQSPNSDAPITKLDLNSSYEIDDQARGLTYGE